MEENIVSKIINLAKQNSKKIVLPESSDLRVLKACEIIQKEELCEIILIGNEEEIIKDCEKNNIDINGVEIINPNIYDKTCHYAVELYNLRKHKGMTLEEAQKLVLDNVYFGIMMVKLGDADGLVSGAIHSTSDTLRPALQIIKQKETVSTVSSFFLMETHKKELGANGLFIFSDCGLIEEPTEEQFVDIVNSSVESFKCFSNISPKVALLSYSTLGSAKGEKIDKIKNVLNKIKSQQIDYDIDGEMQLDAAIIEDVAKLKASKSTVAGHANILIFPNLEAGNIGYKLCQRFGDMVALGPITQGLNKPVNDLSRGCLVEDIVGVVAITCIQANKN